VIVPIFVPFFVLAGVCAVWPLPRWTRRVDWLRVGFWVSYLALYGLGVFALIRVAS
jgi:hypothetical protein